MTDRCTGHCCESFSFMAPDKFAAYVEEHPDSAEALTIDAMLIYLGEFDANPVHADTVPRPEWDPNANNIVISEIAPDRAHFYTCRHFDRDSGNCGNYEGRPSMCRRYPYTTCNFAGCSWQAARDGDVVQGAIIPMVDRVNIRRMALERIAATFETTGDLTE